MSCEALGSMKLVVQDKVMDRTLKVIKIGTSEDRADIQSKCGERTDSETERSAEEQ